VRRLLAGAAAAGLGLVLLAPSAQSAESDWAGSRLETGATSTSANPSLIGIFVRKYNSFQSLSVKAYQTPPGGLASGCPTGGEQDLGTATLTAESSSSARATATSSTPCNGTYTFRLAAHLTAGGLSRADDYELQGAIDVRVPPPAPSGFTATLSTASIDLSWDKPSNPAPDFLGFRVERKAGDSWDAIGEAGPSATSWSDTAPPLTGGEVTYRVRAMRDATKTPVVSGPSREQSVTLPSAPTDPNDPNATTSTTKPGGEGGGGADNGGDGGSTGTTTKPGGGGKANPLGGRSFQPLPRGQIGVGTKAPRLGTPAVSNIPDLVTDDGGFSEELNYGEDGLADGEDGEDGLSSFYYEGSGGQGMAKPVAIGSVFLAWAFHMRFLARAARPEPAATSRKRSKHSAPKRGWA
jgi:hypothetical protein